MPPPPTTMATAAAGGGGRQKHTTKDHFQKISIVKRYTICVVESDISLNKLDASTEKRETMNPIDYSRCLEKSNQSAKRYTICVVESDISFNKLNASTKKRETMNPIDYSRCLEKSNQIPKRYTICVVESDISLNKLDASTEKRETMNPIDYSRCLEKSNQKTSNKNPINTYNGKYLVCLYLGFNKPSDHGQLRDGKTQTRASHRIYHDPKDYLALGVSSCGVFTSGGGFREERREERVFLGVSSRKRGREGSEKMRVLSFHLVLALPGKLWSALGAPSNIPIGIRLCFNRLISRSMISTGSSTKLSF
ncbi:hypothetical protein LXL04_037950 [Taraxacum kok-saghyz]